MYWSALHPLCVHCMGVTGYVTHTVCRVKHAVCDLYQRVPVVALCVCVYRGIQVGILYVLCVGLNPNKVELANAVYT